MRITLVRAAIAATVLVAWLAGPFGVPGLRLGLGRRFRWRFGIGGASPSCSPGGSHDDPPPGREAPALGLGEPTQGTRPGLPDEDGVAASSMSPGNAPARRLIARGTGRAQRGSWSMGSAGRHRYTPATNTALLTRELLLMLPIRYSESECLAALRAAAATLDGTPLRVSDYQRWRITQVEPVPNDQVIRWRFGSWSQALAAAGLPSARAPYRPRGPAV